MVKRMLASLLLLALCASLCACGGTPAQTAPVDDPAADAAQAAEPAAQDAAEEAEPEAEGPAAALPDAGLHAPEESQAGAEAEADGDEVAALLEKAQGFVGKDAAALIQAIGEPLERRYAPSCLGSGEDGELKYEGFTVYTYREGDTETVSEVVG